LEIGEQWTEEQIEEAYLRGMPATGWQAKSGYLRRPEGAAAWPPPLT